MSHTITTDAAGRGTFTCTEPLDARCHEWADCLELDECTVEVARRDRDDDEPCQHPESRHATCLYAEWYPDPAAVESMHLNPVTQESDVRPPANIDAEPVSFEWDECPLWSFALDVYDSSPS